MPKETSTAVIKPKKFHHIQCTPGINPHKNRLKLTPANIPAIALLPVARLDKTPMMNAAKMGPKKADPILLIDSITVPEILPTKNAKPVIAIPHPTVVSLLISNNRDWFFKCGPMKSFTVDADREFKAESRLDIAAERSDAKIRARRPWGRYSRINCGTR